MSWNNFFTQSGKDGTAQHESSAKTQEHAPVNIEYRLWARVFEFQTPCVFDELEYRNTLIDG